MRSAHGLINDGEQILVSLFFNFLWHLVGIVAAGVSCRVE